jgi:hypothetical protein
MSKSSQCILSNGVTGMLFIFPHRSNGLVKGKSPMKQELRVPLAHSINEYVRPHFWITEKTFFLKNL